MEIIKNECKKILNIRILILLCIFTVLYYQLFMMITVYPTGGQCTDSPYDIPFAAQLVKEIGPTLSLSDWSVLNRKEQELKKEYNRIIAKDEVLAKEGIKTFDDMKKREEALFDKSDKEKSKREKVLEEEIAYLTYENKQSEKLGFELQEIDLMNECKGSSFGVPKEKAKEELYSRLDEPEDEVGMHFLQKVSKNYTKDYMSFLPEGMFYILQQDMCKIAILLLICFFVLLVPYQVKERLRNVIPLYATTKTGRKIFTKQVIASLLTCGLIGMIQMCIYLVLFIKKGLSVFWICPAWDFVNNMYWPNISFGTYMAILMLLVLLFTLGSVALAYWVGRISVNYIAGIAISIPVCVVLSFGANDLFDQFFRIIERINGWELIVMAVWIIFMIGLMCIRLKRDRKQDILI